MIEMTAILVWLACLLSYLTSENQKLMTTPLAKKTGWCGFVLLLALAQLIANQKYAFTTALLINLGLVMMSWVLIIVTHGHKQLKNLSIWFIGLFSVSFIVRIGASYVA